MSRRTAKSNKAILVAWNKEQELVRKGKGTREWTPQQQQDILERGKAYDDNGKAFEGQHMKSAEMYPEYQGDPGNIQFLTRAEHLEAHDGNWQNPTNWYFNPKTKEKFDFGDGPFIPCEIIRLPEAVIKPSLAVETKEETITEPINELEIKKEINIKSETQTIHLKTANKSKSDIKLVGGLRNTVKKVLKAVTDFSDCHPVFTGFAKVVVGVVGLAVSADVVINRGHSNSGNSSLEGYSCTSSQKERDYFGDSYDEVQIDTIDTNTSVERLSPEEHMVKGHGQHYHYKDGSVRWKEKAPYSRGSNRDE